ncbi:MAG: class I SAM-dependent methyltransferase [Candidatus Peribacteraceae bacterium]|jgi:ubiquinone/menaquinone biosynthesis C-methylase UbiE|nr:class I SAM-dependent methyltransferase [Candidatus Peribacteraceae bacterium]MDP7454438.1 class I SAM-dependent methyltransferase [Candidatus Peribacteraceae bacterium]MDP7645803.1 class I SAM-dependent methyltransferase [Candidatus Peribacteraceae bacterium]
MSQKAFHNKWAKIREGGKDSNLEERSIYVEKGNKPRTQRQLSLYYYFRFIQKHLEKIGAKKVIELGCGRGTIGLYCKTYMGLDVSLMDNEEDAIKIAREAFGSRNLDAEFIVGDALDSTIPENIYDATVSIGLAEHLDNVDDLYREQFRILRPGGVMVSLNIPKKFSVQELNVVMRSIKKIFGLYKDSARRDYYRNTFSAKEYEKFAKDVGFTDTKVTHVCPFPIYVPLLRSTDRLVTTIRRGILKIRSLVMRYPYKTNRVIAHAHFLVAFKPI